jgi:hypothetical protein
MLVSAKRMAVLREHIRAESEHDMDALLGGMTPDCFNDVVGVAKPFVGPEQTAERYRKHWEGFPDFTVRVRRVLCADDWCVVTENEWTRHASRHIPGMATNWEACEGTSSRGLAL